MTRWRTAERATKEVVACICLLVVLVWLAASLGALIAEAT